MTTRHPGPKLALALVLSAACGPAAPASATLPCANPSPPAAADAVACPGGEALEALIRAEYAAPAAPLERVACIAVREGGPHWFVDGWRSAGR